MECCTRAKRPDVLDFVGIGQSMYLAHAVDGAHDRKRQRSCALGDWIPSNALAPRLPVVVLDERQVHLRRAGGTAARPKCWKQTRASAAGRAAHPAAGRLYWCCVVNVREQIRARRMSNLRRSIRSRVRASPGDTRTTGSIPPLQQPSDLCASNPSVFAFATVDRPH